MIRRALLLLVSTCLFAQTEAKASYTPDPKLWSIQVLTPMGGWTRATSLDLTLKLRDPKDPKPPKERGAVDPDSPEAEGGTTEEGVTRAPGEPWDDFWKRVQAERERNTWRARKLEIWFNGVKQVQDIRVGYAFNLHLDLQDGENRLELRQPDSHQGLVRTIYASAGKERLVVRLVDPDQGESSAWWWGGLQVVEPNGTESIGEEPTPSGGKNHGTSYTHPAPLPGTYTVRWFDSRAGVDGYGYDRYYEGEEVRPRTVHVEILLDPGTDRERRWTFQRLVIPGTKRVTLGSFDVED